MSIIIICIVIRICIYIGRRKIDFIIVIVFYMLLKMLVGKFLDIGRVVFIFIKFWMNVDIVYFCILLFYFDY